MESKRGKPLLAVTMGDPAGIGPELIARVLAEPAARRALRPVAVGDLSRLRAAARLTRSGVRFVSVPEAGAAAPGGAVPVLETPPLARLRPGRWSAGTGRASLAAVERAVALALAGEVEGIVTAPICKQAWRAAGAPFAGHTELLARRTRTRDYAMLFVGGPFRVVLATIHEPLRRVPRLLTAARIVRAARTAAAELRRRFGLPRPRLAVAGLNPHAGEGGLLGGEEARVVAPAVRALRRLGLRVAGPLAPDTLFTAAAEGRWDLVVALYHDQGLIPFKLLALHAGVNVTAGLPIIRTSPDHGTAFDLAGTGRGNPGSLRAALLTAAAMARAERAGRGRR